MFGHRLSHFNKLIRNLNHHLWHRTSAFWAASDSLFYQIFEDLSSMGATPTAPAAKPAKQNACAVSEHTVNNAPTSNSAAAGNTEGTASEGRSGLLPEAGVRSRRHTARAKAKEGTPAPSLGHVGCRLGRAPRATLPTVSTPSKRSTGVKRRFARWSNW